jgi:hypothetical protein
MQSAVTRWLSSLRRQTSRFTPSPKGWIIYSLFAIELIRISLSFSYKFHRLFPLSQYDLPTHNPSILSFPRTGPPSALSGPPPPSSVSQDRISVLSEASSASSVPLSMTPEQISRNPYVDYTRYSGILYHSG